MILNLKNVSVPKNRLSLSKQVLLKEQIVFFIIKKKSKIFLIQATSNLSSCNFCSAAQK